MIELTNIYKTYHQGDSELHALNNVSLTINNGEYLSIMGPSGSGKSTLLNVLGLLESPSSGTYLFDDKFIQQMGEQQINAIRNLKIGFVFQAFHLIDRLTALDNVALPLMLAEVPSKERKQKALAILEKVGLADRALHYPNQLSGGQLQRIAIARALVNAPQIVLADEPTGNLDQKNGQEIIALLEELNKEGITLAVITHDDDIGKRANRLLHMVDGKLSELSHHNEKP